MTIDRDVSPWAPFVGIAVMVVLIGSVAFAGSRGSDDKDSVAPTSTISPTTLFAGPSVPTTPGRSTTPPTTSVDRSRQSTTTIPGAEPLSVVPAPHPCSIVSAHDGGPDFSRLDSIVSGPTPVPEALIPGSTSFASWEESRDQVVPIEGSDYAVAYGSSATGSEFVGRLDPNAGGFEPSFEATGCGFTPMLDSLVVSNGGIDHLWAIVLIGEDSPFLLDIDLARGELAWSAGCDSCHALIAGRGVVRVISDPVGPRVANQDSTASGAAEVVTIDQTTHAPTRPIRVPAPIVPSDDGELWALAGDVLAKVDDTNGAILQYYGVVVSPLDHGVVATWVAVLDGRAWVWPPGTQSDVKAYNLTSWVEEHSVPVESSGEPSGVAVLGAGRIWSIAGDPAERGMFHLRAIDPRTGGFLAVASFESYAVQVTGDAGSFHIPTLLFDSTGFWYVEQVPTRSPPRGNPEGVPRSDGPWHLMHVNVLPGGLSR